MAKDEKLVLVHVELRPGTVDRLREIGPFLRSKIAFFGEHCIAYTSPIVRTRLSKDEMMKSLEGRAGAPGLQNSDSAAIFDIGDDWKLLNKGSMLAWLQHH